MRKAGGADDFVGNFLSAHIVNEALFDRRLALAG